MLLTNDDVVCMINDDYDDYFQDWHRKLGSVPQSVMDEYSDTLQEWLKDKVQVTKSTHCHPFMLKYFSSCLFLSCSPGDVR